MPPKTKEKGDPPVKKAAKGKKVKDVDGGGRGDTRAEDQVAEKREELEERARAAFIGYARTDLFKRNISFGKYNPRQLNGSQRRKLYESFKSGGLQRFSVNNAIPLIIPAGDVVAESVCTLDSKTVAKRDGSHLPKLKLKNESQVGDITGPEIVAAGGRHRRFALDDWFHDRKRGLVTVERELTDLQAQLKKDAESVSADDLKMALDRVIQATAVVAMGGSWVVEVYNEDLVDDELGIHLSSNQRLYVYAETAEEGVIQDFKMLISVKQDWKNIPVVTGLRATSNRYRINALLTQDFVWRLFLSLLGITSTHYIHSDIFKISSLTTNLISPHGGILAAATIFLEDRLRMCFNAIEWDGAKVRQMMDIIDEDPGNGEDEEVTAAMTYLYRCIKRLASATPLMDSLKDEMRDAIDSLYKKHLGCDNKWRYFGTDDTDWKTSYIQYTNEVLQELTGIVTENLVCEEYRDAPDDVKKAWKDCVSKATLVLMIKGAPDHAEFMPFMSVSVWKDMNEQLGRVPKALTEYSSWFSPLLYCQKIVGRKWKVTSATADMLRGISGHPDIADNSVLRAQKIVVWMLFSQFGALLRMEECLGNVDMPPRPDVLPTLREHMLLDGPKKVDSPWKSPEPMVVERDKAEGADIVVRKELNMEVHVVDDYIKNRVSAKWTQQNEVVWLSRWYRTTPIEPIPKEIYRTLPLIAYHTHSFGKTKEKSEARWRKETIIAAIYEYCAIQRYRVPLLAADNSPAAFLRVITESLLTCVLNEGKGSVLPDRSRAITWPDAIAFDRTRASQPGVAFNISGENERSATILTKRLHTEWVQKVVRSVESCPVSWPIVAGEYLAVGKPRAVSTEIALLLDNLILGLVNNGVRHRDPNYDEGDNTKPTFATIEALHADDTLDVQTLHKSSAMDKGKGKAKDDGENDDDDGEPEGGEDPDDGSEEEDDDKPAGHKKSAIKTKLDAEAKAKLEKKIVSYIFPHSRTNAVLSEQGQPLLKKDSKSKQLKLDAYKQSASSTVARPSDRPDTSAAQHTSVQNKDSDAPTVHDDKEADVDENMDDPVTQDSARESAQDALDMDTDDAPPVDTTDGEDVRASTAPSASEEDGRGSTSDDDPTKPPFTQRGRDTSTSDDDTRLSDWDPTPSLKSDLVPTQPVDDDMALDGDDVRDDADPAGKAIDSITEHIQHLGVDKRPTTRTHVVPVQKRVPSLVSPPRASDRKKRARINTAGESSRPSSLPPPKPSTPVPGPSSSSSRPPPRRILRRQHQRTSPPPPVDESEDADLLADALNDC
ncbi:hypothetical protein EV363DRAFT_1187669 [Boletus edulis]|nr:hypothetical protein EV363DRAFT_1187669 [Boletus edulis]